MKFKTKLFATVALAAASITTSANANLITYGWETFYYSDASFSQQIGHEFKKCSGETGMVGKKTLYRNDVYMLCRNLPEM